MLAIIITKGGAGDGAPMASPWRRQARTSSLPKVSLSAREVPVRALHDTRAMATGKRALAAPAVSRARSVPYVVPYEPPASSPSVGNEDVHEKPSMESQSNLWKRAHTTQLSVDCIVSPRQGWLPAHRARGVFVEPS